MTLLNDPRPRASKDDEDPYVLYLVLRESLRMTPGKMGPQIGHAIQLVFMEYMRCSIWDEVPPAPILRRAEAMNAWLQAASRKVLLGANYKEWEKVKAEAGPYVLVKDAGLTQVEAGSETMIACWPMRKSERPKILSRLRLVP
jgi:peptidyl-tRNA hydrolase